MKILDKEYKELKPDPFICSNSVSDGDGTKSQWGKDKSFNKMMLEKMGHYLGKNNVKPLPYTG